MNDQLRAVAIEHAKTAFDLCVLDFDFDGIRYEIKPTKYSFAIPGRGRSMWRIDAFQLCYDENGHKMYSEEIKVR